MKRTVTVAIMMVVAMAASAQQYDWGTPQSYVTADVGEHVEVDADTILVQTTMLDSKVDRMFVFDAGKLRSEINYFPFEVGERLIRALGEKYGEPIAVNSYGGLWESGDTTIVFYMDADMVSVSYSDKDHNSDKDHTPSQLTEDASEL